MAETPSTDVERRLPTLAWVGGIVALLAAIFVGVLLHRAHATRPPAASPAAQPAAPASAQPAAPASAPAAAPATQPSSSLTPITPATPREASARASADVLAAEKLLRHGRAAAALGRFQRTLAHDADDVRALRGACLSLARLGRLDAAARVCRRALDRAPADLETRRALATIYFNGGAYKWSAAEWRRVVRQAPHDAHARRALHAAQARAARG